MKQVVKNKQEFIKNNYLSSTCNHLVCIDITDLGNQNGYIFAGSEVASRAVIMHQYKQEPLQVADIIETMQTAFKHRSFLPQLQIIHSDRESIFKNSPYQDFVESIGVQISRGSAEAHDNQVVERNFRTIKKFMRPLIDNNWKPPRRKGKDKNVQIERGIDPLTAIKVDPKKMHEIVLQAINKYNNKPHSTLHGMTPHSMLVQSTRLSPFG